MYTVLTNIFTIFTVCVFAENYNCHCGHRYGMPHLSLVHKARAIGQLQAGVHRKEVAQTFGAIQMSNLKCSE